jgi:hypothetical protein
MNRITKIMFLLLITIFVIVIIRVNNCTDKYWRNQMNITKHDSLDIMIESYIIDHGVMSFNRKYSIDSGELTNSSKYIDQLLHINYPFKLKKKAGNDTIFVIKGDNTLLNLTFRKNTQDSSSVYDSSFRELFETWREKRKKTLNNGSPN